METMKENLVVKLQDVFSDLLLSGGADKIAEVLDDRLKRNVEDGGEQSAQLTFDIRTRIDRVNNQFEIEANLKLAEKTVHSFRAEEAFNLDGDQLELPINDEDEQYDEDEQ